MATKIKLLFVDDDPNVLSGLRRLLRRFRDHWDMHCVDSGMAALELLSEEPIDAIISDMRMPEMDGAQLLHLVAQKYPHIVRLVLSGQSELDKICSVVDVAHQYLSKPCDSGALENTIAHICDLQGTLSNIELKTFVTQLRSLPCSPECHQELGLALASSSDEISTVSAIISRDIGLSTKVLQLVNTSFFGESRPNCTPTDACHMLGIELLQRLYADTNIFQPMPSGPLGLAPVPASGSDINRCDPTNEARISALCSTANCALSPDQALVRSVGRLIYCSYQSQGLIAVEELVDREKLSIDQAERTIFGNTSAEVGAYLLALWGFPNFVGTKVMN